MKGLKPYPKYKDSGVEWLGEVPEHWERYQVGQLVQASRNALVDGPFGSDLKSSEYQEEGIPIIQLNQIKGGQHVLQNVNFISDRKAEQLRRHQVLSKEIVIAKMAEPVARAALANDAFPLYVIVADCIKMSPNGVVVHSPFLVYSMNSPYYQHGAEIEATGSTRVRISLGTLRKLRLVLPALPEQRAIAAFLDRETGRIDGLIAKKERQIALLQEKRSALISALVTGQLSIVKDPKTGKLKAVNDEQLAAIKKKEPAQILVDCSKRKPSGIEWLGDVPVGWAVRRSKHVFKQVNERSETGEEELLTVSHITGVTPRSQKNVTMFMAETLEGYKCCRRGDLVINTMWAWMGALGTTMQDGIVSPSYNVYRFRADDHDHRYYDRLFRTSDFIEEINRFSKGVWKSRLRLYPEEFFLIDIPVPPRREQEILAQAADCEMDYAHELSEKVKSSIEVLREYRAALVSVVVTGKVDVRGQTA